VTNYYRLGILLCWCSHCLQVQTANCNCHKLKRSRFVAAVHAAKTARYLWSILKDVGFAQQRPTVLYKDNEAAIAMINQCKPTTHSCHIDVQFFAIQEWHKQGDILMKHMSGILNLANDSTKALGWILHH